MSDAPAVEPRTEAAFVELLRVAATDADGVAALASAYADLGISERARLVEAIESAAVAPEMVFQLLAAVLSVETDVAVAEDIVARMKRGSAEVGRGRAPRVRAFVVGDETAGALVIVRGLHGPFVESLALSWSAPTDEPVTEGVRSSFVPVMREDESDALVRAWSARVGATLTETGAREAMEMLATVAWAENRRTGKWPSGLQRFADLL